jgi:hypothetical protein
MKTINTPPNEKKPLKHLFQSGLLCVALCAAALPAQSKDVLSTSLPPSADLRYVISAKQSGFNISGNATVKWFNDGKAYSIFADSHAMIVGKILEAKSEGRIDRYGLAPNQFYEKPFRKAAATSTFNRDNKQISFTQSENQYPINGGEQDRTSIVWHLASVARANAKKFKAGSEWDFFVVGPRDAEPWRFTVVQNEKITTPLGTFDTVHIFREPPPDDQDQKLDIWLAPSQNWYPVRIRFTDPNGDFIDQKVESITPK